MPRLGSAGRIDEALALTDEAEAAAHARANPYWVAYTQWIVGLAWSKADKERALAVWDDCVAHVRKHGVNFFDGFLARDAARLHTSDGDATTALGLFDVAIQSAHQAGNVPQLIITLSSVPALFERLGRLCEGLTLFAAMARQPNSFHHVPELIELGDRVQAQLGPAKSAAIIAAGTELDLNDTATYARKHIALARQELILQERVERPGGLSRREVEVLRLIADGITTQQIAERLFISAKTADRHIQNIYNKIGTSNCAGATRWALEKGVAVSA